MEKKLNLLHSEDLKPLFRISAKENQKSGSIRNKKFNDNPDKKNWLHVTF